MKKQELQLIADVLVKAFRREIFRDGDWWFGTDDHDFNIYSPEGDENFRVCVYKHKPTGTDYSKWISLKPVVINV